MRHGDAADHIGSGSELATLARVIDNGVGFCYVLGPPKAGDRPWEGVRSSFNVTSASDREIRTDDPRGQLSTPSRVDGTPAAGIDKVGGL